jgi:hypothetical protein
MSTSLPFHGEGTCTKCNRKAYFVQGKAAWCGYHSDKPLRGKLKTNPLKGENREAAYQRHLADVHAAAETRFDANVPATVMCSKMTMFQGQTPVFEPGFLNVFPNFKHQKQYGGFGCKSLSPKDIGPIDHGQPGLPVALNLENFHQFSKQFPGETDSDFRQAQVDAFNDPIPHRHKPTASAGPGKNKNIPRHWVWIRPETKERVVFGYKECRQFYCNYYERAVRELPDYKTLLSKLHAGVNLRICGFDGYMPDKSLEEHYLDESRPFGHELVLYTMLVHENDPAQWPWRKHKTEAF